MKRRVVFSLLLLCMLLTMLAPAAYATQAEAEKSGTCGEGVFWKLEGYTLTISGSGEMADGCPWEAHKDHIDTVVIEDGVTKIGAEAFKDHIWIKYVEFGQDLREIGSRAFYGCKRISLIHLPKSFRLFGPECFRGCESLKKVYCDGGMPSFKDSCLWTGSYISVFYPTNNPWPWEYTSQLISSYGGNMGIFMGNYDASAAMEGIEETQEDETQAAEAATEAAEETLPQETAEVPTLPAMIVVTEETVQTEAATEPSTEPEQTTAATTEPTTIPTTEAVEETTIVVEFTEATEPVEEVKAKGGDGWMGLVMIAGVITFLLAGAMIFRSSRRNRY